MNISAIAEVYVGYRNFRKYLSMYTATDEKNEIFINFYRSNINTYSTLTNISAGLLNKSTYKL